MSTTFPLQKSLRPLLLATLSLTALAGCGNDKPADPAAPNPGQPAGAASAPSPGNGLPKDVDISTCKPGKYGGTYISFSSAQPTTFNLLVSTDATSSGAIGAFLEGLTRWDPMKEEVIPGLAKSWEIGADSKTFTFHLREGALWSDGEPFTSADVAFTFAAIYDKRYENRHASDFAIDGKPFVVEALDPMTVRITTPDIYAPFLEEIGIPILPKHKLQAAFDNGTLKEAWNVGVGITTPQELVSNSAFRLRSMRSGESMVYERNPNYWRADSKGQRLPYIELMVDRSVGDQNAETLAFSEGKSDSDSIRPDQLSWVEKKAAQQHFTIYDRGPSTSSSFVWFNQNPGKDEKGVPFVEPYKLKWFQNQKFRQAVSYGIDRAGLIKGVFLNRASPQWGPESPANARWYNPDLQQYPFDPEKSRALLKEAGFKYDAKQQLLDADGNRVVFTLNSNQENPIRVNMCTVFKENMRAIGIEVQLQMLDFQTFVRRIGNNFNYEAGMLGLTGGRDPAGGMSVYLSSGRMHEWYPSQKTPATPWEARIDELMNAQLKTLDFQKRKAAWFEVQRIMSEQVPLIYLVTPNTYSGIKNKWQNIELPTMGPIVWNIDEIWEGSPDSPPAKQAEAKVAQPSSATNAPAPPATP